MINSKYSFNLIRFKDIYSIKNSNKKVYGLASSKMIESCPEIDENFPYFFYLANQNGDIASWVVAIPDILKVQNMSYQWAWFGGLYTSIEARGKGLATRIIKESREVMHRENIAWGGVFSNELVLRLYRKLNYCIPGHSPRYLFLKSLRPFLAAHMNNKYLKNNLNKVALPVIKIFQKIGQIRSRLDKVEFYSIECKPTDNNIVERIYEENKNRNLLFFDTSPDRIAWKLAICNRKKENECVFRVLTSKDDENVTGYYILRTKFQRTTMAGKYRDFKISTVMDFGYLGDKRKVFKMIMKDASKIFWESDAEVLEIITNDLDVRDIIKSMGMFKIGRGMSFKFSLPGNWRLKEKDCCNLKHWRLNHFCGDGFTF
jgi:hypothetical protein